MNLLYTLDLIGTFAFAVSGVLSAANKRLDLFGALIIGFVTALGGGTIRDLLLGMQPVGWIQNATYLYIIIGAAIFTFIFKQWIITLRRTMFLFDTIGIGVFTVLGMQKALMAGISPVYAILMGMVSAVVGGVVRDVLCNNIPLILKKEIYATVCLMGGILYFILDKGGVERIWSEWITVAFIVIVRVMVIRLELTMPQLRIQDKQKEKEKVKA